MFARGESVAKSDARVKVSRFCYQSTKAHSKHLGTAEKTLATFLSFDNIQDTLHQARKKTMAKKTTKKTVKKKKAAVRKKSLRKKKELENSLPASMPDPHFMEQMMGSIFGNSGSSDVTFNAQQHAFDAMEAMGEQDWNRAHHSAVQAVEIDPNCVDALHILAQLGSENDGELIDNLRLTVKQGEKGLGKKFFRENEGHFWGLIETRPYMRVRAQLAQLLYQADQMDEAIGHYEELLRLNPGDNQGLRYSLLGCYLEQGNLAGAERLFSEFENEGSAMFAWARVLANVLAENKKDATKTLKAAREVNKHVEAFLTGRKKLPTEEPAYYSFGDTNEAIICVQEIGTAWTAHPDAIVWLKQQKAKRK